MSTEMLAGKAMAAAWIRNSRFYAASKDQLDKFGAETSWRNTSPERNTRLVSAAKALSPSSKGTQAMSNKQLAGTATAAAWIRNSRFYAASKDQLDKFSGETSWTNTSPEVPALDSWQTYSHNLENLWDSDNSRGERDYGDGWSTDEEIIDGLREAPAKITSLSKKKKEEWHSVEKFNDELHGPDCKVSRLHKQSGMHDKISAQGPSSSALSINHVLASISQESKVARSTNEDYKESITYLSRSVDMLYHFMSNHEEKTEDLQKQVMVLSQAVTNSTLPPPFEDQA